MEIAILGIDLGKRPPPLNLADFCHLFWQAAGCHFMPATRRMARAGLIVTASREKGFRIGGFTQSKSRRDKYPRQPDRVSSVQGVQVLRGTGGERHRFALGRCGQQTFFRRTTSPGAFKQLRGSASALRSDL